MQDQLPKSVEAEEATIGGLLVDTDQLYELDGLLKPSDFSIKHHEWIYDAALHLHQKGSPVDLITMMDELDRRGFLKEIPDGIAYLSNLISRTPSAIHTIHYAKIVHRTSILRRAINAMTKGVQVAYNGEGELADIIAEINSLVLPALSAGDNRKARDIGEIAVVLLEKTKERAESGTALLGLPTGLTALDKMLLGLVKTDMIVLAGRPGMGKSALAFNIGLNVWDSEYSVAAFSLEMSDQQLVQRLVANKAKIGLTKIRTGDLTAEEWQRFAATVEAFSSSGAKFIIDDTPAITPAQLRSKAIKLVAEGVELIIVDYLQLMRGGIKTSNRTEEVSYISSSIKAIAKELNVPILALAQLNRNLESRQDKRPRLSDLKESGSIEQDSDVVLFIYRDEMYDPTTEFPNVAEIIVGKHRQGETGVLSVYFRKEFMEFVDLEIRTQTLEW